MNENRYLLFYVGTEVYGAPLLDVKEVIEYQEQKPVPNMVSHFTGVINLRGAIVGVIDLRKKFGVPTEITRMTTMLICETKQGMLAAIIDRVESVNVISSEMIDANPPVVTRVKSDYLAGIARLTDRLVTLVNLKNFISDENLVQEAA